MRMTTVPRLFPRPAAHRPDPRPPVKTDVTPSTPCDSMSNAEIGAISSTLYFTVEPVR